MRRVLFKNIGELLTLRRARQKSGRFIEEGDLSIVKNASLVAENDKILWLGREKSRPQKYSTAERVVDCGGCSVIPGLIESHTHSIFAGSRSDEFELRNTGVSYSEIAKKGGGILSTMRATRKASEADLVVLGQQRVARFLAQGVTTLEVKSGYALSLSHECKMLRAAKKLKKVRVIRTYLGAHAIPGEYSNSGKFIDHLIAKQLPAIARERLAERVDIFIEKGFFSLSDGKRYLQAAKELGFALTVHADQMNRTGATRLGIEMGAKSVDHVIEISHGDIEKLAKSETVANLLPSADFYLDMKYPPARKLLDAGACVAIATDFNPGSSPTQDLALTGLLARKKMKMTLPEVLSGYTVNAAKALGLENDVGSLEQGKLCDLVVLDSTWKDLFYNAGHMPVKSVWRSGKKIFGTSSG